MMEKYGVEMDKLPPTDEQLRLLRKIAQDNNIKIKTPKNRQEAEELLEKLQSNMKGDE